MATGYLKSKQKLKGIRYMLLAITAINALISIIFNVVSSFLENPVPVYLQSLIVGLLAYIVPIFIYAKITGMTAKSAEEQFYLKKSKPVHIIFALMLGLCWQFVMVVIRIPLSFLLDGTADYSPASLAELLPAMLIVAFMPAVFEEFLFRGIVDGSMSKINSRAAVIFSSIMFAVVHASAIDFGGYILMGVILTSIIRRTKSVYCAMAFHLTNNIAALLLGYFSADLMYAPELTIGMFAAGMLAFVLIYTIFTAITKKPKNVCKASAPMLIGQSFINLPILLCIAVNVCAFVIICYF